MILLGIVADAMPKGNKMSIIGIYILVMIILCAVGIVISTTLQLIIDHISGSKSRPPKWLRLLFCLREKSKKHVERNHLDSLQKESEIKNGFDKNSNMSNEVQAYTKDLMEMMSDIQLTVSQMFEDMKKTTHHDGNDRHNHHRRSRMNKDWEYIFLCIRYFLIFLFEVFNVVNLLVFVRYGWMSPPGIPKSLL
uniref:Neurotransmitter-gated ion-channel transmembrane domain-containing protein n=1 Tax=Acrobeloides nanus TaxID=290746 RepID=A0A914DHQ1_9BILA